LGRQIDVDPAREREGDDERRRHEEVRAHRLVNARLEVSVAGKNGGGDEIVLAYDRLDARVERAGVAYAGRTAVADQLEAEMVEVALEARLTVILRDDARAGRERRLDGRRDTQPALDRLLRQKPRGEHDAGVRGVRAGSYRCDDHVAVSEFGLAVRRDDELCGRLLE